jgi:hypothetical protein
MIVIFILVSLAFELTDEDHSCIFSLDHYFHFGPSNNLCFISIRINTLWKWITIVVLTMLIDAVATLSGEFYSPWAAIVLGDPEGPPTNTYLAHIIQQVYYINYYLQNAIWTFVALTQVDLLMFSMLSSCGISLYTTNKYLKQKRSPLLLS